MDRLSRLLTDTFAPYDFSLDEPRPDGGRVLTVSNEDGEVVMRRVIAGEHLDGGEQGVRAIQAMRRDLAVQEGQIEDDVIVALRQRAQVLRYGT
ncbi:hypothetical protein D9M71_527860 [compost metagenome]